MNRIDDGKHPEWQALPPHVGAVGRRAYASTMARLDNRWTRGEPSMRTERHTMNTTTNSIEQIKVGDTIQWTNGFGDTVTAKVLLRTRGTDKQKVVSSGILDGFISVQHLINIYGTLTVVA